MIFDNHRNSTICRQAARSIRIPSPEWFSPDTWGGIQNHPVLFLTSFRQNWSLLVEMLGFGLRLFRNLAAAATLPQRQHGRFTSLEAAARDSGGW
jgi:hypothetical protein